MQLVRSTVKVTHDLHGDLIADGPERHEQVLAPAWSRLCSQLATCSAGLLPLEDSYLSNCRRMFSGRFE
jgi:hypothetical protein